MTFLPIVDRELRVAARRRSTFWVRAAFALGAIVIGGLVYLANLDSSPRAFADNFFGVLVFLAILYCLLAGVRLTADCLSEEKREGTLGLLFLTDLKGYDVVFGKLAACSLNGFYGLLAIFPILGVPLLVGGISQGEIWRLALVLVNTILFSLAAGALASALSQSPRKAMALTFSLIFLSAALLPACAGVILLLTPSHRSQYANILLWPCPIYSVARSTDAFYRVARGPFWCSMATIHALTWLYLLLASWLVPHSWQEKPAEGRALRRRQLWHKWLYGDGAQRKLLRQRLLEVNACYWLAGRIRSKPVLVWLLGALAAGLWGWGCVSVGSEWFNEGVYFPTAIILNSVLKLWVASEAGRCLGEDRKTGTLELVLGTTLSVKDVLRGQWLALRRQFLGPLAVVVGVELIFLAASLQRESVHDNTLNPALWVAGILMLLADLTALGWVAMWTALTAKSPNRITGITVTRLLLAPWAVYVGVLVVVAATWSPDPKWPFYVGLWFGLGMVTDLVFGLVAWWQLRTRFRQLAMQRFAPVPSLFTRLSRIWKRKS